MTAWLSVALFVLTNLPEIIRAVKTIMDLISEIKDKRSARVEMRKLRQNVLIARKAKDFSGIEEQLARLKEKCQSC